MASITLISMHDPGFDGEREPIPRPIVDHREAFSKAWPDDRWWFVPYTLVGEDLPSDVSARVNKSGLASLQVQGYSVAFSLLVAETDVLRGPVPDPAVWGRYRTKKGWRYFAELSTPVRPTRYEALVRWAHADLSAAGVVVDTKPKDWTRAWRLPGDPRYRHIDVPVEFPLALLDPSIAPEPVEAPRKPLERLPDVAGARWGRSLDERLALARRWLEDAPVSVEGEGGDDTAFKVAQVVVRGHGVPPTDAVTLLIEWNARCLPPWPVKRLEYKVNQAVTAGTVAWGASLFEIRLAPKSHKNDDPPGGRDGQKGNRTNLYLTPPPQGDNSAKTEKALHPVTDEVLLNYTLGRLGGEGEVGALNGDIYLYKDKMWHLVDGPAWTQLMSVVDGESPDPTRWKPISVSFNRRTSLRRALAEAIEQPVDDGSVLHAHDGAVMPDGRVVAGTPPIGVVPLAHPWDSTATCPRFEAFMSEVLPDVAMRELVREFVALCMLGKGTDAQTVLCFEGAGANGKSTLTQVIWHLFSPVHRACVSPHSMNVEQNLWPFERAKINIVSDISSKQLDDPAVFKQVVAGDPVMSKTLYVKSGPVTPRAGHIFSTNLAPRAEDESHAFLRRWMIVYFSVQIAEERRVRDLATQLWKEESMGIARWFFDGIAPVQRRGLVVPDEARQEMRDWEAEASPVKRILGEILTDEVRFKPTEMLERVNTLLAKERCPPISGKAVVAFYRAMGFVRERNAKARTWIRRTALA